MYPELTEKDLFNKNVRDYIELGEGSKEESWLFRTGSLGSMSEEERTENNREESKVRWFRARAELERWQEEVEILGEEFRRCIRGFEKMEDIWGRVAEKWKHNPGYVAYACSQASSFARRAQNGKIKFLEAGGSWPEEGVRLADHVKAERPNWDVDWDTLLQQEEEGAEQEARE
ncbi:hypothetical protein VKT23_014162 [Stygiomarasmius scandens]|uniref:Uncharacterized protein n=1 Tax=Marasmiellus scandens TaxID=2682957 RepID=A0ABR1J1Q1_9AGAR